VGSAAAGAVRIPVQAYLASAWTNAPHLFGLPFIVNLPAVAVVVAITIILVIGSRNRRTRTTRWCCSRSGSSCSSSPSERFLIRPTNWTNPATGGFAPNGFAGISAAAAIIFFAYIGFDAVSTGRGRNEDPGRDMPFGIVMSLLITTVLYIAIAIVMTGIAPWKQLGTAEPMITALQYANGPPALLNFSRLIVALGAVLAMGSVLLVFQLGQAAHLLLDVA
jgi:APA family basic amino acid/polyamine antiporter